MGNLYPNFKLGRLGEDWECCSMEIFSAAVRLRQFGVPGEWGDPVEAIAWFDHNGDGRLRALVADYRNGKRVIVRQNDRKRTVTFSAIAEANHG